MTNEELVISFRETKEDDLIEKIIKKNVGLIYYVMKRYSIEEAEKDDLYQEGSIGILRAVDKFNPYMSCKFSTYAIWHIRACMTRYMEQKINKHKDVSSLNIEVGHEQDIELQELIKDENIDIEDFIKTKLENQELYEAIQANCSELERKAIQLYYYYDLTYKETQEALQMSNPEQARLVSEKGIRNIRESRWGVRKIKEMSEEEIDDRTNWIKNQIYNDGGGGNSHRTFSSSVEDNVLFREKMREGSKERILRLKQKYK